MKKYIAILTITALMLCLLTGCGSSAVSANEAQAIAIKDLGVSEKDVQDAHTHVLTEGGKPCYSIHITVGDAEYEYTVSAEGEILSSIRID